MFPLNKPFICPKIGNYTNNKTVFSVYVFNTTTYDKYVREYRTFYSFLMEVKKDINYEIQYYESEHISFINLYFIPHQYKLSKKNLVSINILLFDGLSRMAFNQQFRKTQNYLLSLSNDFYIYDMLKYHTVGTNSRPNYVPLFYGVKYSSITSKKKSLFNYFHDNGYITISLAGYCDNNIMNYGKPETYGADHNINIACHPSINNYNKTGAYGTGPRCIYNKRISYMFFDYIKDAHIYYSFNKIPTFSFTSFSDTHDGSQLSAAGLDEKMKEYFITINKTNSLKNTITFIMGDHGIHYGKYYNELENSIPPLIIIAHKSLLSSHQHRSLIVNQNRLLTPYNIFYTLKFIAKGFKGNDDNTIFQKIPLHINCRLSKIDNNCNCLLI